MHRTIVVFVLLMKAMLSFAQSDAKQYLQLKERLDRPTDGYCLDVVGSGNYIRFDMPLTAHNCKGPEIYADEVVEYRSDKTLYFPAYKGCVTVMGLNDKALSGNALMLKECGVEQPFLNAKNFQKFECSKTGQVRLMGSHLCISVGTESHTTYSLEHRWRNLMMKPCGAIPLERSVWKFVPAGQQLP